LANRRMVQRSWRSAVACCSCRGSSVRRWVRQTLIDPPVLLQRLCGTWRATCRRRAGCSLPGRTVQPEGRSLQCDNDPTDAWRWGGYAWCELWGRG
jgi:hypothetical protein